jgi:hypothetical protein
LAHIKRQLFEEKNCLLPFSIKRQKAKAKFSITGNNRLRNTAIELSSNAAMPGLLQSVFSARPPIQAFADPFW